MPYSVGFDSSTTALYSAVSGVLTAEHVHEWEQALYECSTSLPPHTHFQFVDDLRGYEVSQQDPAVHRLMRVVTPRFLADHGFAVGFWRLYEEVPPPPTRHAVCRRVAHLHHDCAKMERYTELLASRQERFFCAEAEARAWVAGELGAVEHL